VDLCFTDGSGIHDLFGAGICGPLYSRTSNNGHCRGIQILSVIGGVR
jgi:hypothetical protein